MLHAPLDLPTQLVESRQWDKLAALLTNLQFLEAKAEAGKVFELAEDFDQAIQAIPPDHPWALILRLLEGAVRTDLHFIAQHPGRLFQCLWNRCWWYDCPEAAEYYEPPASGWPPEGPPWQRPGLKLASLMESWRREKEATDGHFRWIRSLRPLPFGLATNQRAVFRGEWQLLSALAFASDGKGIIAWFRQPAGGGEAPRSLRVWEWLLGVEIPAPRQDAFPFADPSVSPDRCLRLRREAWTPLQLCDAASGTAVRAFSGAQDGDENISCVAFSPDGRRIAAGAYDTEGCGAIYIWDAATGRRVAEVHQWVDGLVWAVAFSPDGQRLASGHSTGAIQVWDASTGYPRNVLTGHGDSVAAVAFSPDGRHIVSGSRSDGTIRVWDAAQEQFVLGQLKGHPDCVKEMIFSTDGERLVTRSGNDTVWLWSARSGAPIACLHRSSFVVLEGGGAHHCLFADAKKLVHLSTRGIRIWAPRDGAEVSCASSRRYFWHSQILFSPDGERCLIREAQPNGVDIIAVADGSRLAGFRQECGITSMAFSPDGQRVASAAEDATIRLWDSSNGAPLACLRGHDGPVTSVAFSPDGRRLASASADKTVRLWDSVAGTPLACLHIDEPGVWRSRWSAESGEQTIHGVSAVAFTSDGCHIVTLSRAGMPFQDTYTTRVWDEQSGSCIKTLQGIGSFAALCAGSRLVIGIQFGTTLGIESGTTGPRGERCHLAFLGSLSFLAFIDSRKR